jgi:hypothetical protein
MEQQKFKIANYILLALIGVLALTSTIALVAIHWELFFKYDLLLSPQGVECYLSAYGQYETLFTATLGVAGAYFAFLQLNAAVDTYRDKIRYDFFTEWKTTLEVRLKEIERDEPYMGRQFVKLRFGFFKELYEINLSINSKEALIQIFKKHFINEVNFLEKSNRRFEGMGGIYPDAGYSYSFDNFRFVFLGCLDSFYPEIERDLKELYLAELPANRTIDISTYQYAIINYIP